MVSNVNDLSRWVEEYTEQMVAWACHKVSDADLAQDLVQDTFLAAAEKINDFKGDSSPKTWLFAILNYKIIDVYRKKVKAPVTVESSTLSMFFDEQGGWAKDKMPLEWADDTEGHLLDNNDFRLTLQKCMEALPEKWLACVNAKFLTDKKGEDICQELDIAATNYWQIIRRAKLQLRNCIEKNWFVSE